MTDPRIHLSAVSQLSPAQAPPPADLGRLDLLGRMPIPLRRPFKVGLDRVVEQQRATQGQELACCFLSGGEWYRPFDGLLRADRCRELPGMVVTPFYHDILAPSLLRHYTPERRRPTPPLPMACAAAGLIDPLGAFQTFAVIPFLFLVDESRLGGRPAPRTWADLLEPQWADDIVFGGWRPNEQVPYQDYNDFLLLSLYHEFGAAGLAAFARNVRHLQHNIRTATQAGSNSRSVGAIAVLPWLQAELAPRRHRLRVVWPADGALAMPIGYLLQPAAEERLAPLVDYLTGSALGGILARNCYPPINPAVSGAFPSGVRLKWPGWEYARSHDLKAEGARAAQIFFRHWYGEQEARVCS